MATGLKRAQKNAAALAPDSDEFNYLRDAVADQLCDRLQVRGRALGVSCCQS